MVNELTKRILTSSILFVFFIFAYFYSFILIILLILISLFSWIEFSGLINKILDEDRFINKILKLVIGIIVLAYLSYFSVIIFNGIVQNQLDYKIKLIFLLFICIGSDVGGFIFGKIFKGKKLTKISPNKTINGSLGSFLLPLILIPILFILFPEKFVILNLIILVFTVSLVCQLGDLFISYLKRRAKVKDTGDLLPGHGGILDRIDGILFAIPFGINLWKFLIDIV